MELEYLLIKSNKKVLWNLTVGVSIGEPYALIYTSRTAYVSYAWVYYPLMPSTLIIDCVTSCRLLKYICLKATTPVP